MEQEIDKIIREIEYLKNKGTEPAPEYYTELFVRIMKWGTRKSRAVVIRDEKERFKTWGYI